jgi:MinD-like ATPase involved in chromosome partitioning or flagellar assembly
MGQIIAVMPASGGVGATSLAAAIAVRAAAAQRTVVAVDLDPWSGGLDVTFGVEQEPGWRWDRLAESAGLVDGLQLAERLPHTLDVAVLAMPLPNLSGDRGPGQGAGSGGAGSGAVAARAGAGSGGALSALPGLGDSGHGGIPDGWVERIHDVVVGLAEDHDLTVLDLGRDDRVLRAVVPLVDALVVVAGVRTTELAAAAATLPIAQALGADPWVVLRGPGAGEVEDLVIDELDVDVVAAFADDHRVVGELAEGIPPGYRGRGPLVSVADRLLLRLVMVDEELGRSA